MELGKMFGTDKAKEQNGVWFKGPKETEYLVARQGNKNYTKLVSELTKPYRALIEKGLADPATLNEISAEAMSRTVLLDWRGITDGGKPLDYTPAIGKQWLLELPDFADFIFACSKNVAAYQAEELKAAAGN